MECHIEQVLYRDQRTIKMRTYSDERTGHRHQRNTCPTCKTSQKSSKKCVHNQSYPSSAVSFPDGVADDAISIRGVPNSSLYCNCHNQYCSKFKRLLYQTEVQCGCDDVSYFTEVSEKKAASCKSSFMKFHNFLLIGTYLSLVTFPYISAVPTTISSRSATLEEKGTKHIMNTTYLNYAYRAATKVSTDANELQRKLAKKWGNDPKILFKNMSYDWLPAPPAPGTERFEEHLKDLTLEQVVQDTLRNAKLFSNITAELCQDLKDDDNDRQNSSLKGSLEIFVDELHTALSANNMEPEEMDITGMPENLKNLNKTDQTTRDWLIISGLVDIMKYTLAVFQHFNICDNPKQPCRENL